MPRVSIVIPLYNAEAFIIDTLKSIVAQSMSDWEAIVVDDGSTDGSWDAANTVADARIRVLQQANAGPSAARNRALEAATSPWIAMLDADDLWGENKLESQLTTAARCEADLVFGPVKLFGAPHQQREYKDHEYVLKGEQGLRRMISRNHIPHSSVLVRRDLLVQMGGYSEDIRGTEDYDLWLRLLLAGAKFVYDPRGLTHYRLSGGSVSSNKSHMKRMTRMVLQRRKMPSLLLNVQRQLKMMELRVSELRRRTPSS